MAEKYEEGGGKFFLFMAEMNTLFAERRVAKWVWVIIDEKNTFFSCTPNGKAIQNHTYISLAKYVVDLWMNSEGHRKNILNPNALQLGCGNFFYREKGVNIPKFMSTQNFQLYEEVIEAE